MNIIFKIYGNPDNPIKPVKIVIKTWISFHAISLPNFVNYIKVKWMQQYLYITSYQYIVLTFYLMIFFAVLLQKLCWKRNLYCNRLYSCVNYCTKVGDIVRYVLLCICNITYKKNCVKWSDDICSSRVVYILTLGC